MHTPADHTSETSQALRDFDDLVFRAVSMGDGQTFVVGQAVYSVHEVPEEAVWEVWEHLGSGDTREIAYYVPELQSCEMYDEV